MPDCVVEGFRSIPDSWASRLVEPDAPGCTFVTGAVSVPVALNRSQMMMNGGTPDMS